MLQKFKALSYLMKKKQFLRVVFFCFLGPIFIMLISAFVIYNNYKNLFENELKENYISNLSALAENIDNSFNELQYTTTLLSADRNLYNIFYTENKLDTLDSYKIKDMIDTLVKFKATNSLIDSVYLLHKESDRVLDASGTCDIETFYSRAAIYEKYDRDFWMNYSAKTNFFQILDPSPMESITFFETSSKRNVIPLVTSNIESFKSKNLFVINISGPALTDLLNKYKLYAKQ